MFCLIIEKGDVRAIDHNSEVENVLKNLRKQSLYWSAYIVTAPMGVHSIGECDTLIVAFKNQITQQRTILNFNYSDYDDLSESYGLYDYLKNSDNVLENGWLAIDNGRYRTLSSGDISEGKAHSNHLLLPKKGYVLKGLGDSIELFDKEEAISYRDYLRTRLEKVGETEIKDKRTKEIEPKNQQRTTEALITSRKNRIAKYQRSEYEKARWIVTDPLIGKDFNLPNIDLVFKNNELDGVGSIDGDAVRSDWMDLIFDTHHESNYYWDDGLFLDWEGFDEVIRLFSKDSLKVNPSSGASFYSLNTLIFTFNLEEDLKNLETSDEYVVELTKKIDDKVVAEYSLMDNRTQVTQMSIFLNFPFKKVFGYFPNKLVIVLKDIV